MSCYPERREKLYVTKQRTLYNDVWGTKETNALCELMGF